MSSNLTLSAMTGVCVAYAIKVELPQPHARRYRFTAQKTMYGGKHIGVGDTVYIFASEAHGGHGLLARGRVTASMPLPATPDVARQTPRVDIDVEITAWARQALGRDEVKRFDRWHDGQPQTEINFKFYRQATPKIVGVTSATATFLDGFFRA